MTALAWLGLGVAALIAFVILEGKRQERKYGRGSGKPNLAGVGMLELQRHLQPDRKVDVLQKQQKGAAEVRAAQSSGDPSEAGG